MAISIVEKFKPRMHIRYLCAGIWNAIFGYFMGVLSYKFLINFYNIIWVGVIANIASISMSFLTYKIIVFRTRSNWMREYLRCYIVYGFSAIFGILLLWIMIDQIGLDIWYAQGLIIILNVIISYFGHKFFTFRLP